jgi:hypothetical protein
MHPNIYIDMCVRVCVTRLHLHYPFICICENRSPFMCACTIVRWRWIGCVRTRWRARAAGSA